MKTQKKLYRLELFSLLLGWVYMAIRKRWPVYRKKAASCIVPINHAVFDDVRLKDVFGGSAQLDGSPWASWLSESFRTKNYSYGHSQMDCLKNPGVRFHEFYSEYSINNQGYIALKVCMDSCHSSANPRCETILSK